MAKKMSKKKPVTRSAAGKKVAKKTAKKAAVPSKAKAAGNGLAPVKVGTGGGASAAEIGRDLVALFNAGKADEVEKKWWSPKVVSVEGVGMAWNGAKAATAKNQQWYSENEILGGSAEGPYVGASGFSVKFRMHVKHRASGKETMMDEVGVYTVQGGKIVREEFMYGGG
ncbi:MAG: hypothetical protein C0468_04795 [Planctomyces sp.]|nr:hypothetical protein [Planctomyces sp.]